MKQRKNIRTLLSYLAAAFLIAVISAFAINFWHVHRDDGKILAELDALLDRGDKENEKCKAFRAGPPPPKLKGLEKEHQAKSDALAALDWLERYPPLAPGYAAAMDLLIGDSMNLGRNVFPFELAKRRNRVGVGCDLIGRFQQINLLAGDRFKFSFSNEEKKRIEVVLEEFFLGDFRFYYLMDALIKIAALENYLRTLPASHPAKANLPAAEALGRESEARRSNLSARWSKSRWDFLGLTAFSYEQRITLELFSAYYPLARSAFRD